MTYLKGWCFLPVAGFLLLVVVPAAPEVVDSMSDCAEFFLEGTPPEVPGILESGEILDRDRYKTICQTFENRRRFVTLYDTVNRIPVFSAYKYRGHKPRRPNTGWKIEPQLEEMNTANMRDDIYRRQASNDDYKSNSTINNRGHLFPVIHAFEEDDKKSTFTLTNIVPQAVSFNNGRWQKMESCMQCVMQKYCINNNNAPEGYVVTGAKPSNNNKLKNRVNIPSFLWTAFCCYSSKINKWLASAHWGDNVAEQPGSEEKNLHMPTSCFYNCSTLYHAQNYTYTNDPRPSNQHSTYNYYENNWQSVNYFTNNWRGYLICFINNH
ncbi:endonuclease domain-containing 1 protein-like [Halichoeres trimaculatus]|uniref:endonuclease domain-containing 1 protein-like n=1 Tax=Halichoeres trimaculatus TaxID=147232 RepID=UPI003D9F08C9